MSVDLKTIHNFKIDRSLSPTQQNKILMSYLEEITEYKTSNQIIGDLSKILEIPKKIIKFEFKYFFFLKFRNSLNTFFLKTNYSKILISYIKVILIFFYILFFSTKKTQKKFFELIIDDVDYEDEYSRTKEVGKKFESYLIIGSLNKNSTDYYYFKYKNIDLGLIFKSFTLNFISKLHKYLFFSIKNKINYIDIYLHIFKLNLKYNFLFNNFKSKFLFQERNTHTSKIKQYLFKKHGGLITSSLQKNITQLNGPGSFCAVDVLFSLGKRTHERLSQVGADVKKIFPVGSLYLNLNYFNKPKDQNVNSIYNYDILNLASRMDYYQDTHEKFIDDWYEHFSWLSKLSVEFPELKIAIKQRYNNFLDEDKRLNKILKNSNVKIIIGKNDIDKQTSYNYCFNSKVLCTWSSTVAFEMIGHKIPCLIMSPNNRNESFFPNDDFNNKFKITNYDKFKENVLNILKGKKSYDFRDSEDYCLNSKNTLNSIASYLKQNK